MAVSAEKMATKTGSSEFYAARGGLLLSKHAMTWECGQKAVQEFNNCHIAIRQELTILGYSNKQVRALLTGLDPDSRIWAGEIGLDLSGPCKWLKNGELVQLLDAPWVSLSEKQKGVVREAFHTLPLNNRAWAYPGTNPVTVEINQYGGFRSADPEGFKRLDFNAANWDTNDAAWLVLVPNTSQIADSTKTTADLLRSDEDDKTLSEAEMKLRQCLRVD